jgi:aconitate hydratase
MITLGQDSLKTARKLKVGAKTYTYFSLKALQKLGEKQGYDIDRLPFSLKVLLENLLRFEDGRSVTTDDIEALAKWGDKRKSKKEIAYRPARVLMQDFTGVPAVVDLAAMRSAVEAGGGDPKKINPQIPVDLVIDHSVMVDNFGKANSFKRNVKIEYERNKERYEFLRWGSKAFDNFRVVPPGTGICHQVNLEYLAKVVWTDKAKTPKGTVNVAYPDTLVGTDSHTTMVNGMAVLGWGVGGIEAEAAMLGQPVTMLIPEVVGFKLTGKLKSGLTSTDMVLTIVEMLRKRGVVGKFVEFFGPGLNNLSLEDQATIANMAPEYGATCGFFPIDKETLAYLKATGRKQSEIDLVEKYAKAQGMFRTARTPDPVFTDTLELALGDVVPSISGPKRPQDRIDLDKGATQFAKDLSETFGIKKAAASKRHAVKGKKYDMGHGDVVVAAITSCTNTSNPSVLIAAGLVARNAAALGMKVKPWVKTSLAPGSQVVTDYLEAAGLQDDLDTLGFNLVGYGCTTCIGNSGPLDEAIVDVINDNGLVATSVLSGNRNFEGRIGPDIQANYLASPPLVVAYALAGNLNVNVAKDALGEDKDGNPVYLKDIWPSSNEISDIVRKVVTPKMFRTRYGDVFKGDAAWQKVKAKNSLTYSWDMTSTYIQLPPYFQEGKAVTPGAVTDARVLGVFGDSVTTDHISPAGAIKADGPAGKYLTQHQVRAQDFNSYGSRRGNHEVMMRGTFANIRIKNEMVPGTEGGVTVHYPSGKKMSIFDAAMKYQKKKDQLVIFGGKEYGTGSSRDWAAKGTTLLGVSAVIVESFERIHRSNLIGMGVLPLQFKKGADRKTLKLDGSETVTIKGLDKLKPRMTVTAEITYKNGKKAEAKLLCRIDTEDELDYYKSGGILQYVLGNLAA